jgi:hypothetical protein
MWTIIALLLVLAPPTLPARQRASSRSESDWSRDLSWLVKQVETIHPGPFLFEHDSTFHRDVRKLRSDLPGLDDPLKCARMMQLVASLRDGHSHLDPLTMNIWFPLRCYLFTDGLFITAIQDSFRECAGARVLRFGNAAPERALALSGSLKGANNRFGAMENSVLYLSNAGLLKALGIIDSIGTLTLRVQLPDGTLRSIALSSRPVGKPTNWMQWGEMYGPVPDLTTFFGGRVSGDYRKGDTLLPPHLRRRLPFWFEYMPGRGTVYFQFNFVSGQWNGQTFQQFTQELFSCIDTNVVRKFVIDLRYNSGGDGSILDPFLHEIIKRDRINRKGVLYVLVGRKTFSAAVLFLGSLKRHTNAYFAGEPAGAPLNHFGEPKEYPSPDGRFILDLSTLYYQAGDPADRSDEFHVDFPYQFTSHDYFSGADPLLDLVTGSDPVTVPDLFLQDTGKAIAALQRAAELRRQYPWYTPFTESDMNSTGYQLLGRGEIREAIKAFTVNAEAYPASWNVWDSLAEACMVGGDNELALRYYRKSVELNPGNQGARDNIDRIGRSK